MAAATTDGERGPLVMDENNACVDDRLTMEEAHKKDDDDDDEVSPDVAAIVVSRQHGVGAVGGLSIALATSAVMGMTSVAMLLEFRAEIDEKAEEEDASNVWNQNDTMASITIDVIMVPPPPPPVWMQLFLFQTCFLPNLIHAALLSAFALAAVYHGHVICVFFCRNIGLFFGVVSAAYVVVDVVAVVVSSLESPLRLVLATGMTATCTALFASQERTRRKIIRPLQQVAQQELPLLRQQKACRALNVLVLMLQFNFVLFVTATICRWLLLWWPPPPAGVFCEHNTIWSNTPILAWEESFREAAHPAFLLAAIQVAQTYPQDLTCLAAALLPTFWRLVASALAVGRLICDWTPFALLSCSMLCLEMATSGAILAVLIVLCYPLIVGYSHWTLWRRQYGKVAQFDVPVTPTENDTAGAEHASTQVTTMSNIGEISSFYDPRQRRGARLFAAGSKLLATGMTVEAIMAVGYWQSTPGMSSSMLNGAYAWGMHIAAMFVFCEIMSVSHADVMLYAKVVRPLLLVACSAGTIFALWQVWILWDSGSGDGGWDVWSLVMLQLFLIRAISGLVQIVGLAALSSIDPVPLGPKSEPQGTLHGQDAVRNKRRQMHTSLWCYGTAFLLHLSVEILQMTPFLPMAASTEHCNVQFFSLVQSWPGLSLFFHFGILIVVLALGDELYRPSIYIAWVFSLNLLVLQGVTLISDFALHTKAGAFDPLSLLGTSTWAVATASLCARLHSLWRVSKSSSTS